MRLWYLRRGVPWAALGGCLAVAAVLAATAHRWPSYAVGLLPFAVAAGAAAAGFLLDEEGASMVGPTPRGGRWARLCRLSLVPLVALVTLAMIGPGVAAAGLSTGAWGVVTLTSVAVGVASAGALRGRVSSPGTHVAAALVMATAVPLTVGGLLEWDTPWPLPALTGWQTGFWAALGVAALVVLAAPLLGSTPGREV